MVVNISIMMMVSEITSQIILLLFPHPILACGHFPCIPKIVIEVDKL